MSLTKELTNFRAQFQASQPQEIQEVMAKATIELMNSKISEQSLKVGDQVPNFTLPNAVGNSLELQTVLDKGAVVISFYRGGWCPYCNLELRALQQSLPDITALGATLIAISPETPDNSLNTSEKNELTFEVLSDSKNQVAKKFGLVFKLAEELRPVYTQFGIDVPAYNGDSTFELPIPATYVVTPNGKIAHSFINVDYTQRLDPREILTALNNLAV